MALAAGALLIGATGAACASSGASPVQPAKASSALLIPPPAPPVVKGSITLDQAIAVAMQDSPAVKLAQDNYLKAGGVLRSARGSAGPNLGIQGNYIRFDKVDYVTFGAESIPIDSIDQKSASATLSQPIDLSGVLRSGISAARLQRLAAAFDLDATQQDLALNVRQAYLAVLEARDQEQVNKESVDRLQEYLRLANVRLQAGTAPKFDVLRAQTDLANAEQQLIAAQNSARIAELTLGNVMGVTIAPAVDLTVPKLTDRQLPAMEDLIAKGERQRPEAKSAEASLQAAKQGVHIARRGLSPAMALSAQENWTGNTTVFSPRAFKAQAMLTVSLPIFDSGVTKGQVEQAKAAVSSAEADREQTDLGIRLDVEQAYVSIENARKRLTAVGAALAEAEEALRLAQVRYENGVGTAVEVTDAQVANTQARTNDVLARYDLYLSFARLARAVGDPSLAMD